MARIERSKKYISDAMLSLLKTKSYEEITINDIVEKAGVSRMTFYRQFYDKKSVIKYILDSRTDNFIAKFEPKKYTIEENIIYATKLLVKDKELAKILINSDLFSLIEDEFSRVIIRKKDYTNSFLVGGLANIYYYYVSENREETAEELAEIIINELNTEYLEKQIRKEGN